MKVVTFFETGFNASNIPDSPDLLAQCSHGEHDAIDILQDAFLDSIRIRVNPLYSNIENVDYCYIEQIPTADIVPYNHRLGRRYYFVTAIEMLARDTAKLYLQPDYLSTCGGAKYLGNTTPTIGGTWMYPQILDGFTERVHVSASADVFGAFTEADPLTTPSQPLQLKYQLIKPSRDNDPTFVTLVEASVDLYSGASGTNAKTFTDPATGESVTVPFMPTVTKYTVHQYGGAHGTLTFAADGYPHLTAQQKENIRKGTLIARGLAADTAIVAQYSVPSSFISNNNSEWDVSKGCFDELWAIDQEYAVDQLPWIQYQSVQNKRLLYGEFTKYGMVTMAGNRCEYKAEEIYDTTEGDAYPIVKCKPDLRSDGRPYYRYRRYLNDASATGFWNNCLAGANWANVPLLFARESGDELNRLQYNASRTVVKTGYDVATDLQAIGAARRIITAPLRHYEGDRTSAAMGQIPAHQTPAFNLMQMSADVGTTLADTYIQHEAMRAMYRAQGAQSAVAYAANHEVVAPQINFPYQTSIMRDALENGVICYRYYYSQVDVDRIDKLLTMYGYRVTKPLENSDFNNRSKFNYVQAHGVTLGGVKDGKGYPQRLLNGAAEQLEGGVRVWHVLPDPVYYTNGTNI